MLGDGTTEEGAKPPAPQPQPCQFVVVVSENLESEDILLASKVVKEEVYQRQQDTLVVWTEPTGVDTWHLVSRSRRLQRGVGVPH